MISSGAMKSLLVPITRPDHATDALTAAVILARRFGGYVEGYYAQPTPQVVVADAMGVAAYSGEMTERWLAAETEARSAFDSRMAADGLTVGDLAAHGEAASAGWRPPVGSEPVAIGEYARAFDLAIVGRRADDGGDMAALCEDALFDSGRPILLVPGAPAADFGRSIVIHWNGSTETARTLALGMTFLEQAEAVCVLTVEGAMVPGPSAERVAAHLRLRGVPAQAAKAETRGRQPGEIILAEAAERQADMLFKGAFTHGRLRQLIFGGATRDIMAEASVPVFMAH